MPSIVNLLLTLPRLGSPFLSQLTYEVLSELFSSPAEDNDHGMSDQGSNALKAVLSSPPSKSDTAIAPAWLNVVGNAMLVYRTTDPEACAAEVEKVWKIVWPFLESNVSPTRQASASSLSLLCRCFTPLLISSAIAEAGLAGTTTSLSKIIEQITNGLDSLSLAPSIPEILAVISSLIYNLRYRASRTSPSAAETLLLPLIQKVGDQRTKKGFEFKDSADKVLATAMLVVGPEVLFRVLPLNLEPSDRYDIISLLQNSLGSFLRHRSEAGREPRAFLLPLLSNPHPSPLGHFVSYFVPMSERMFDLQQKAESDGRQSEAKVWSVLVAQIWAGLAGYCFAAIDLKEVGMPGPRPIIMG